MFKNLSIQQLLSRVHNVLLLLSIILNVPLYFLIQMYMCIVSLLQDQMHFPSNNTQYMYNKPDALFCNVTCQLLLTIILHVCTYISHHCFSLPFFFSPQKGLNYMRRRNLRTRRKRLHLKELYQHIYWTGSNH